MEIPSFLDNWPGKSARDGGPEHPAVYHMLDVAAVAERLLAPYPFPSDRKAAFAVLVSLHDLGKIGDGFRAMIREKRPQGWRHWELTEAWLLEDATLCQGLQASPHALKHLIAAIAGHHGRPSVQQDDKFAQQRRMASAEAQADVTAVIAAVLDLWPDASLAGMREREAQQFSWWLAGLTTTADWIGSNTGWFPACAPDLSLPAYLERTRAKAVQAVADSGLGGSAIRTEPLFDFALRSMQQAALDIALPEGPVLAFIEDETGAGKTEAALILAQRMLTAGKGRGLYFALPTMATADAMFGRAEPVMGRLFDQPSLTLAHGRAGLSERFRDLVDGDAANDKATCAAWLADNRRRALLADVGIGTVDQALLAVLRTRFSALRLWGLSSKILIVDEAHEISGDGYMAELLQRLLQVHAAQGGSAVLLTATLPLSARRDLTRAFATGARKDWPDDTDRAYPSLSIPGGQVRRDFPQGGSAKGPVRVERLATAEDASALLADAAGQGAACVWVRNAVDEAIAACADLRARGIPASLLHARFALCDRKRIEAAELARFGHGGRDRVGRVLVATQIVESSLDLDFDVMVSDLAPMAALVQRAGRLWRHMDQRPREIRPVPGPVLHVLSPDPATVDDARWLTGTLGAGGWVYPVADQWRTAAKLFDLGRITAPAGLRDLIEAVHDDAAPLPEVLAPAEMERIGAGYALATLGDQNAIGWAEGYRSGAAGPDDTAYPTRLGPETATLILARRQGGGLVPWAAGEGDSRQLPELWMLSEVSANRQKLEDLALPDQNLPEITAVTNNWPNWRKATAKLCPVAEDGTICEGLRYDAETGLLFTSLDTSR